MTKEKCDIAITSLYCHTAERICISCNIPYRIEETYHYKTLFLIPKSWKLFFHNTGWRQHPDLIIKILLLIKDLSSLQLDALKVKILLESANSGNKLYLEKIYKWVTNL